MMTCDGDGEQNCLCFDWQECFDGYETTTQFGKYTICSHRLGWECHFHCICCKQLTKVVTCRSDLPNTKRTACEHHKILLRRYQEALEQ